MSIGELGSIGEFVAAIATVITLVYLALQIRANTAAVKAESRRSQIDSGLQYSSVLAGSAQASSVFRRGLAEPRDLDPDERLQFEFLFSMVVSQSEAIYHDYELGIADDETLQSGVSGAIGLLSSPGGRFYWKRHGSKHRTSFGRHLENTIEGLAAD